MVLKKIRLKNFRNFPDKECEFGKTLTVILGENSRGKTNLLEGVYVSVNGIGFRESKEEELLHWHTPAGHIETEWETKDEAQTFTVSFQKKEGKVAKLYYVNKTKKPHIFYRENQTKTVLFAPEHINIINGSPDLRRDYFNTTISLYDFEYRKKLRNYEHALYKRNKILEFHAGSDTLQDELLFWDGYLETHASYITAKRQEYMDVLNSRPDLESKTFRIEYIKNEFTQSRLIALRSEEMRLRRTVIGPHKDDFVIYLSNGEEKNIHHFGSRSEQRLGMLWLKLNEISMFEKIFKIKPLLLLDDIFSELDIKNKKLVIDLIGSYQTILTTTEKELLDIAHFEKTVIPL